MTQRQFRWNHFEKGRRGHDLSVRLARALRVWIFGSLGTFIFPLYGNSPQALRLLAAAHRRTSAMTSFRA